MGCVTPLQHTHLRKKEKSMSAKKLAPGNLAGVGIIGRENPETGHWGLGTPRGGGILTTGYCQRHFSRHCGQRLRGCRVPRSWRRNKRKEKDGRNRLDFQVSSLSFSPLIRIGSMATPPRIAVSSCVGFLEAPYSVARGIAGTCTTGKIVRRNMYLFFG